MKQLCILLLSVVGFGEVVAQREGPPRRFTDPETIQLASGARVEFDRFQSESTGGLALSSVFLPPSYDKAPSQRFPVIYFLHGNNNDQTSWAVERYGNIPARIEKLMLEKKVPEFVMVHPYGGHSFYTDYLDGTIRYEQLVVQDMIRHTESRYRVRKTRKDRAIGGVSMGGYGALKIAMKHPQLYASVAAASPIILLGDDPFANVKKDNPRMLHYFSQMFKPLFDIPVNREAWRANSVEVLAANADLSGLNIYFIYGTDDRYNDTIPMEKGVRRLHQILNQRKIPHTFNIYPGEPHGWELVTNHLEEMIGFLAQTF